MKILGLALLTILACAHNALACSCASQLPQLCDIAYRQDAVFVGAVTGMVPEAKATLPDGRSVVSGWSVTLSVQEAFWGVSGTELKVHTGSGRGDCGFPFKVGGQYLVFANRSEGGLLAVNICGYSSHIREGKKYLPELRQLTKATDGARISGIVSKWQLDLKTGDLEKRGPLAGIKVSAKGELGTASALAKKDGSYEITGLIPGKYVITPELPDGLTAEEEYPRYENDELELLGGSCAQLDFRVRINGRIRGRVLDSESEPASDAKVVIRAADDTTRLRAWEGVSAYTDENGEFFVESLPEGDYVVGVNLTEPLGDTPPYRPTYSPGTSDRGLASVIHVPVGGVVEKVDILLSEHLKKRTLNIRVLDLQGKPAPAARVIIRDAQWPDMGFSNGAHQVDNNGELKFEVFEGRDYIVEAEVICADRSIKESKPSIARAENHTITVRLPPLRECKPFTVRHESAQ